jgi:hypothetical protein
MKRLCSYFLCCTNTNDHTISQQRDDELKIQRESSIAFSLFTEDSSSIEKVETSNTIFQYFSPVYYLRKYLLEFIELEEDVWKERLYYPHSFYCLSTVVIGFTIYGLVVSFPYSLVIISTGTAVGFGSYFVREKRNKNKE